MHVIRSPQLCAQHPSLPLPVAPPTRLQHLALTTPAFPCRPLPLAPPTRLQHLTLMQTCICKRQSNTNISSAVGGESFCLQQQQQGALCICLEAAAERLQGCAGATAQAGRDGCIHQSAALSDWQGGGINNVCLVLFESFLLVTPGVGRLPKWSPHCP